MADESLEKIIAGRYRIDSVLRSVELGKLYRATDLLEGGPVTVKLLSPVFAVDETIVGRFVAEAEQNSGVSHPSILRILDFGSGVDGPVFIVYEDVEGVALKDEVVVEGAFELGRALDIAEQIAAGLVAAHAKGVVHGCLGGDKVLLTRGEDGEETVKIVELGTAASGDAVRLAAESAAEYLSPEQCADPTNFDARADVYSLGVMLYEMLTGQVPFHGTNAGELMMKHSTQPPPELSSFRTDLPEKLEPVIMSALAKNRDLRYQTMEEFLADLTEVRKSVSPLKRSAASGAGQNVWKTAFIVLVSVLAVGAGVVVFMFMPRTDAVATVPADPGSFPVQPLNPATGFPEQDPFARFQEFTAYGTPMTTMDPMMGGDGFPIPSQPPADTQGPIGTPGPDVTISGGGSDDEDGVNLVPVSVPTPTPTSTPVKSPTPAPPAQGKPPSSDSGSKPTPSGTDPNTGPKNTGSNSNQ